MNIKLYGLLPSRNSYCLPTLYGYSTKGLPGIEIVGLGSAGKSLKQKIIFMTREMNKRYPMRRFVLSVEGHEELGKGQQYYLKNLELGFLILFWNLSGILSISRLDHCICAGHLNVRGELAIPDIEDEYWKNLSQRLEEKNKHVTIIGPSLSSNYSNLYPLSAKRIIEQLYSD